MLLAQNKNTKKVGGDGKYVHCNRKENSRAENGFFCSTFNTVHKKTIIKTHLSSIPTCLLFGKQQKYSKVKIFMKHVLVTSFRLKRISGSI